MYDPRGYIAKWYEGSGTYKYDVNVTYNAGNGTVWGLLNEYASKTGKSVDEILNSDDIGWLDCRNTYSKMVGDFEYPEHVLRYYSNDSVNTKVNA